MKMRWQTRLGPGVLVLVGQCVGFAAGALALTTMGIAGANLAPSAEVLVLALFCVVAPALLARATMWRPFPSWSWHRGSWAWMLLVAAIGGVGAIGALSLYVGWFPTGDRRAVARGFFAAVTITPLLSVLATFVASYIPWVSDGLPVGQPGMGQGGPARG